MLHQARLASLAQVQWREGSAERIPLDDDTVDLVWMSQVFHHLDSVPLSFREVRRVARTCGYLAIRNGTRETDAEIEWRQCFPEALAIDEQRTPSRREIVDAATAQGFEVVAQKIVYQRFAVSYTEYHDKIGQRGLSSLITISDEAFIAGLQRLKAWVSLQPPDKPVFEPVDLFLFSTAK